MNLAFIGNYTMNILGTNPNGNPYVPSYRYQALQLAVGYEF
jgi:hypothetical protein